MFSAFLENNCNKSIDRLLALLLGLRYRQVVTLKRTYVAITILWVFYIVLGIVVYYVNLLVTSWWGNISILLCLVTSTFSYTKIFLTLRHNQIQPQEHVSQAQSTQANTLKGSSQCIVDASNISCLLSAVFCCSSSNASRRIALTKFRCSTIWGFYSSPKLVIKYLTIILYPKTSTNVSHVPKQITDTSIKGNQKPK